MTSSTRLLAVAAVTLGGFVVSSANAKESPAEPDQPRIIGSTARTAALGYSMSETRWHLANIDHRRWDVKADETLRWLHLNGPQFFPHAWVHRDGPKPPSIPSC